MKGGDFIGIFGNMCAVVAAPFVITTVIMGAIPTALLGVPVVYAVCKISEFEDNL